MSRPAARRSRWPPIGRATTWSSRRPASATCRRRRWRNGCARAGIDTPVVALAYDMREVGQFTAEPTVAGRSRLPVAGRRPAGACHREIRRGPAQRRARHGRDGRAGDPRHRRQRPLLLVVSADDLRRADAARAQPDAGGRQPVASADAAAGAAEDPALQRPTKRRGRYFADYEENILGVISDVEFPRDGRIARDAGLEFARQVRARQPDVPIMLQSTRAENQAQAREAGASFLLKGSPTLLQQLRRFMVDHLGFGDFVFRTPDGREVGRARDLRELEAAAATVPGRKPRLSRRAQPLLELVQGADRVRAGPSAAAAEGVGFPDRRRAAAGTDARDPGVPPRHAAAASSSTSTAPRSTRDATFCRLGGGSLGGKARGLAFVDVLLSQSGDWPNDSRRAHSRAAGRRARHRRVRRVPRAERPARLRARKRGRARDRAPVRLAPICRRRPRRSRGAGRAHAAIRSRSARRACSRIRSISRSPASTRRSCCRTITTAGGRAAAPAADGDQARLRVDVQPRAPNGISPTTPYRLEEEKMAVILQRVVGDSHGGGSIPTSRASRGRTISIRCRRCGRKTDSPRSRSVLAKPWSTAAPAFGSARAIRGTSCSSRRWTDTLANAQRQFYALELGRDSATRSRRRLRSGSRRAGRDARARSARPTRPRTTWCTTAHRAPACAW